MTFSRFLIIILGMLIAAGYAAFYLYKLTPAVVAGIVVGVPCLLIARQFIHLRRPIQLRNAISLIRRVRQMGILIRNWKLDIRNSLFLLLHFVLVVACFVILFQSRSTDALRSPWEVIPSEFFILYFIASIALVGSILFTPRGTQKGVAYYAPTIPLLQISLHTFLAASVAVIVYQIGYGFDPFIHRAAEKILIETGTINPKPFMYIGQYALVSILHHLTHIPYQLIDKWLVPVLGSLLLPPVIFSSLKNIINDQKYALSASLLPLLLPFSYLFVTVPQNLANIFLIILIFISLPFIKNLKLKIENFSFLWFLALITLFIHPLGGIPALIYVAIIHFWRRKGERPFAPTQSNIKKILFVICHLSFVIIVPLFFLIGSLASSELSITLGNQALLPYLNLAAFNWLPFHSLLHSVYWYEGNRTLIFFLLTIIGLLSLVVPGSDQKPRIPSLSSPTRADSAKAALAATAGSGIQKPKQKEFLFFSFLDSPASWRGNDMRNYAPLLITFLILLANLFFSKFLVFSSLVNYEQGEFYSRLWQIALLFLMPFFAFGILHAVRANGRSPLRTFFLLLIVSCALLVNAYLWYPRVDELTPKARGYSVSHADVLAVRWIENDAKGEDYVVLANQSMSAAALQELGFKKYYTNQESRIPGLAKRSGAGKNQEFFFYPIPTGGPLYQLYLKMVYDAPDRKYIDEALRLTGAERAYFVLNDYWLDAQAIKKAAQREATSLHEISRGKVMIFSYSH